MKTVISILIFVVITGIAGAGELENAAAAARGEELSAITLKEVKTFPGTAALPLTGPYNKQNFFSAEKADSDMLASLGRGARITLSKDLEIPANLESVMLPAKTEIVKGQDGYQPVYYRTTFMCAIDVVAPSPDRRVIKAGTAIEFNGEAWSQENGAQSHFKIQMLGVGAPSGIRAIGCLAYRNVCDDLGGMYCDPARQAPFRISDFRNVMRDLGAVNQAEPVIIKN